MHALPEPWSLDADLTLGPGDDPANARVVVCQGLAGPKGERCSDVVFSVALHEDLVWGSFLVFLDLDSAVKPPDGTCQKLRLEC